MNPSPPNPVAHRSKGVIVPWLVAAAFGGLAWRQLAFVRAHGANVMFGDQWDFYQPLFEHQGWWASFTHQHGPHRQGAGFLVARLLAQLSGWDSRWDGLAACGLMIVAGLLGLRLARRFQVPARSAALVAVPLLFLNVHQYETFVGPTNLSHGVMPMVLFMAYCLVWFWRGDGGRLAALSGLTFLLIFTGFGIFVGLLTPLLVAIEGVQALRAGKRRHGILAGLALAATGVSWALFAHGYTFQPAVADFRFPYEHPSEYFVFVGRMLANFFGCSGLSQAQLLLGLALGSTLMAIACVQLARCLRHGIVREPRSVVLFCLSSYVLLYCANTAIGRVFIGPYAPLAPRYVTLLIPAGLALFLQIWRRPPGRLAAALGLGYALLLIPATAIYRAEELSSADWYADGRRNWKAAYLMTHSEEQADRLAKFSVYPAPLGSRLTYLEQHRLNLFRPERP